MLGYRRRFVTISNIFSEMCENTADIEPCQIAASDKRFVESLTGQESPDGAPQKTVFRGALLEPFVLRRFQKELSHGRLPDR